MRRIYKEHDFKSPMALSGLSSASGQPHGQPIDGQTLGKEYEPILMKTRDGIDRNDVKQFFFQNITAPLCYPRWFSGHVTVEEAHSPAWRRNVLAISLREKTIAPFP